MEYYKRTDYAHVDFLAMIEESWTFERLSIKEQRQFKKSIKQAWDLGNLTGTYKQQWRICQAIYNAFLNALDYEPFGWREPSEA